MNMKLNSENQLLASQGAGSSDSNPFGNESSLRLKQMEKIQYSCQIQKEASTTLDIPFGADQFSDFKESLRMRTQSE